MQQPPRHKRDPFPQRKWREYADETRKGGNQSFKNLMQRCNQRAREISHKAQMTSATWDEDYWYEEDEYESVSAKAHWMRRLFALFVLLPLAIICVMSLYDQLITAQDKVGILLSIPVWYTLLGCLAWVILVCSKLFTTSFVYLYVLGHELTHALAIILSLGKISGFSVALEGGHVKTNKDNLFIALSPYFIPLWAVIWTALYALVNLFYPLDNFQGLLYGGIGFWWSFHLFWTAWIIPRDQPDLRENDTFFSLMVVYLANMLLLIIMLALCDIVSIRSFAQDLVANAGILWSMLKDFIAVFR